MSKLIIRNYKTYSCKTKQQRKKQLADFYNANFPLSKWSKDYFNKFLDDKNERKMLCLILEKNQEVAGFILGRIVGNINHRYNLTTILVNKNYRNQGLSKILLDEFLKIAKKDATIKKVYLHFRDSNNLQSFYSHYGFRKHRLAGHYSNGEKKHYMEITL